jgi:hypothetical protein
MNASHAIRRAVALGLLTCLAATAAFASNLQSVVQGRGVPVGDPVGLGIRDMDNVGLRQFTCTVTDPKNGQGAAYGTILNNNFRYVSFPADFSGFFHLLPGRHLVRWEVEGQVKLDQFEVSPPLPGGIERRKDRH